MSHFLGHASFLVVCCISWFPCPGNVALKGYLEMRTYAVLSCVVHVTRGMRHIAGCTAYRKLPLMRELLRIFACIPVSLAQASHI
jgi:hypothetical protein